MTHPLPARHRAESSHALGVGLAVAFLVLAVTVPLMHPWGEQQGSRLALTAAVWDSHTLAIDGYDHLLGRDLAVRGEVTYSDKAPGQPLLAVPFYAAYRLTGGVMVSELPREDVDIPLWWLTVWSAGVPAALLAALAYRWAREVQPETALAATMAVSLGTLLLVYSSLLFGHVLAGLMVFSAFLLVRRPTATRGGLLGAGLLAGLAVLIELPVVLVVAVLVMAGVVLHGRRVGWLVTGGLPGMGLLAWYNTVVAGSPFVFAYQWTAFNDVLPEAAGVLDAFPGPSLDRLAHVLFSQRGLLVATPVLLMAILGMTVMWRRGRRVDASVAAASLAAMLLIQVAWSNSYAGGAGPRYVVPAIPFLVAPLAVAFTRWRRTTLVLASVGLITMMAATLTIPQLGSTLEGGLGLWLNLLLDGQTTETVFTRLVGVWGWGIQAGIVVVALVWLIRIRRDSRPPDPTLAAKGVATPEIMAADV